LESADQASAGGPISILIVEDHRVVAEALASLLSAEPDLEVRGIAGTVKEAVASAAHLAPDVVLLDWRLSDGTGGEAATGIQAVLPEAAIVFLSADDSEETMFAALEAGAAGYLSKSTPGDMLVEAVRGAAAGEMLIPPARLAALLSRQRQLAKAELERRRLLGELTAREKEILRLMVRGIDNRGIASDLHISYETVRTHIKRILEKLGARTKLEAVVHAIQDGLAQDLG
jgi:DNA-binding NarL/FixJ family response regulator